MFILTVLTIFNLFNSIKQLHTQLDKTILLVCVRCSDTGVDTKFELPEKNYPSKNGRLKK